MIVSNMGGHPSYVRGENAESTAADNKVKSETGKGINSWFCRLGEGCEAVCRWVKMNPLKSLYITIVATGGAVISGLSLNSRKITIVNSSNLGGIEIPPHLLRSSMSRDIFINNSGVATDVPDMLSNSHSGTMKSRRAGSFQATDNRKTRVPVGSAPKNRTKRHIPAAEKRDRQGAEKNIQSVRENNGCTAHPESLKKLKKDFSKQTHRLKEILNNDHFKENKKILLSDIKKSGGLESLVDKLEQSVAEMEAGRLQYNLKYHGNLEVVSLQEYASFFSPTKENTLPALKELEIAKAKNIAKDVRSKLKNKGVGDISRCLESIKKETDDQERKIKSMVRQTGHKLDCFLVETYQKRVRPRYDVLKTKLDNLAQSSRWPNTPEISEPEILNECTHLSVTDAPAIHRVATDEPSTARPTPCPESCPLVYLPVCGRGDAVSDRSYTYPSECLYRKVMCANNKPVDVVHQGECEKVNTDRPATEMPAPCQETCPLVREPICARGDDGHLESFVNECVYKKFMCKQGKPMEIVSRGVCEEVNTDRPATSAKMCPPEYDPICVRSTNDGRLITYPSICVYESHVSAGSKPMEIVGAGECGEGGVDSSASSFSQTYL